MSGSIPDDGTAAQSDAPVMKGLRGHGITDEAEQLVVFVADAQMFLPKRHPERVAEAALAEWTPAHPPCKKVLIFDPDSEF